MSEFCLRCFNRINSTDYTDEQVKLSKGLELCEGCGQYKIIVEEIVPSENKPRNIIDNLFR